MKTTIELKSYGETVVLELQFGDEDDHHRIDVVMRDGVEIEPTDAEWAEIYAELRAQLRRGAEAKAEDDAAERFYLGHGL
jgi:predicted nucleic acid-binding protein